LGSLEERDALGGYYPSGAVTPEDRRRWNEARLLALAIYHTFVPSMLAGEYSSELYLMSSSIYGQSRTEFTTGTDEKLASAVAMAVERGWL
jgi:hypothetical protein